MSLFGDLSEVLEAEDAGIMLIGKHKVKSVSADDSGRCDLDVFRDRAVNKHLFARPLVYAHRARASEA